MPLRMKKAVVLVVALAASLAGFSLAFGLCGLAAPSLLAGAIVAGLAGWATQARLTLDEAAAPRALRILSAVVAVVALAQLGRITVFMTDPSRAGFSQFPSSPWELRHSCLTAYHVAGHAAGEGKNVFDPALYNAPDDDPTRVRRARTIGPFGIDVYEYPPPFLLLARGLNVLAPDFMRLRTLWHGVTLALLLGATLAAARLLGPAAGTRALLLAPFLWASPPLISTLQKGNVQTVIVATCVLAFALFRRRLFAAGGLLLAFATLAKLFPGMLVVYLLARRQWRAVAWTAAMGAVLLAASLLDTGLAPYRSFLEHLPGLLSGEAFPAFRNPVAMAINVSAPGTVFKLHLLGVPGMGFPAAKVVGWIWTIVILAATVALARRAREDREVVTWLAVLLLATLRSPFLPQTYGVLPPLWLLTLFAATLPPTRRVLAATSAIALFLWILIPQDWTLALFPRLALLGIVQAVVTALPFLLLRRTPETAQPA
jgi:alpha-1,2-mannosyltransferase